MDTKLEFQPSIVRTVGVTLLVVAMTVLFNWVSVLLLDWVRPHHDNRGFLIGAIPALLVFAPFLHRAARVEITDQEIIGPLGFRRVQIKRIMVSPGFVTKGPLGAVRIRSRDGKKIALLPSRYPASVRRRILDELLGPGV